MNVTEFWGYEAAPLIAIVVLIALPVVALIQARLFPKKI